MGLFGSDCRLKHLGGEKAVNWKIVQWPEFSRDDWGYGVFFKLTKTSELT
jgi:hypothetical protein